MLNLDILLTSLMGVFTTHASMQRLQYRDLRKYCVTSEVIAQT